MEKVNFVRLHSKLPHTNSRIDFLLNCRSFQLTPAFILRKTSRLNHVPQEAPANKMARLSMLNEEIISAFRAKAYLQRSLDRSAYILMRGSTDWLWLYQNCKLVFAQELRSGQNRLFKKLETLSLHQNGVQLNLRQTKTCKHVNWLVDMTLKRRYLFKRVWH